MAKHDRPISPFMLGQAYRFQITSVMSLLHRLTGVVLALAAYQLTGAVLIVLPALVAALVVAGECWLAIEGFGRVLDRTDPSAVEAAEENA